jgi:tetratricopeptide (TPR) repeat protein
MNKKAEEYLKRAETSTKYISMKITNDKYCKKLKEAVKYASMSLSCEETAKAYYVRFTAFQKLLSSGKTAFIWDNDIERYREFMLSDLIKAIELDPNNPKYLEALAFEKRVRIKPLPIPAEEKHRPVLKEVIELYSRSLCLNPFNNEVLFARADIFILLEEYGKAINDLNNILKTYHWARNRSYEKNGVVFGNILRFVDKFYVNENRALWNFAAILKLGQCYKNVGEIEESIKYFEEIVNGPSGINGYARSLALANLLYLGETHDKPELIKSYKNKINGREVNEYLSYLKSGNPIVMLSRQSYSDY